MAQVLLDDPADAGAVALAVGDLLVLRLPETATTGYVWQVSCGAGLVEVAGATAVGAAPGAQGLRELRLRAERPGSWPVHLRLARPWEDAPAQQRRVDVTVG